MGRWAEDVLPSDHLVAPHLLPVEVGNVLRRAARSGEIDADTGAIAHAELQALPVDLLPYAPVASRAWELRENLTLYDAWYVALAELLGASVATLDARLAGAPGSPCDFVVWRV